MKRKRSNMKTWHFDIKLGNGQVVSIDAKTFEQAFALLKLDHRYVEGAWSLVGVEDKISEPNLTDEEIKKQSNELWGKINYEKIHEAVKILDENYEAFKTAMEFDHAHLDVIRDSTYAESKGELKDAEKCVEYAHRWYEA